MLVLPEQTISRSFDLLPFKSGAARMAIEAGVPLAPGDQLGDTPGSTPSTARCGACWRLPVSIRYGPALHPGPDDDPVAVTGERREAT